MHRFKTVFITLALACLIFAAPAHRASALGLTITITFGHGEGCKVRGGICSIVIDLELRTASGTPPGNAGGALEGNELAVHMTEAIPEGHLVSRGKKQWLVLASDVAARLSPEAAKKLGKPSLTIMKGEYPVMFGENGMGSFTLKVKGLRESPTLQRPGGK